MYISELFEIKKFTQKQHSHEDSCKKNRLDLF